VKAKTLSKINQMVNKEGKQNKFPSGLFVRFEDLPKRLQKRFMPKRRKH
jgi:hypothetical protein